MAKEFLTVYHRFSGNTTVLRRKNVTVGTTVVDDIFRVAEYLRKNQE
ncbi:hypothetical protein BRYFOR_08761 [Marvinbryantia formatexigens DSM 14469]|uniref:Uncharacterized protein n=1 Tax=Marvinbryantia formatexigens DSM 14469 TaxID=478749 RepID=C6LJC6_9FIRM|nr:hypothetical protein BRYFOR_08761 [Marvinbryantia formatexigens DSM 14469]